MQYRFNGISGQAINKIFPGCVPCRCYDDDEKVYKIPRYDVEMVYSSTQYGYGVRLTKEIYVECDCCGAREKFNVERYEVYSNSIPW